MKAIVQRGYGPPDDVLAFRDVDPPGLREGDVLVRNRAAAVDIGDWLMVEGLPYFARPGYGVSKRKELVAGQSFAGEVEAVGGNVTRFEPGDEVFGWCSGGLAELVAADQWSLALRPEGTSPEQAAATPASGMAALQAIRDAGGVRPGHRVLIIGASGGVGTFAVQIAKSLDASVTGVCGTENLEMVLSLGADHVIDYTKESVAESGRQYDVVIDLAGNRSLSELRSVMPDHGTLVIVGGSGGRWFMGFGRTIAAMLLSLFVNQRLSAFFSKRKREDLRALSELLESGAVVPVIDRTYPISSAVDAYNHVGERRARGKTVVIV
ncbi:MAG: NAD(P)-dependent alcohol dehydrogenase [Actinomycetota bacterium]